MKKVKIAHHDVQIYDSIEELPITRFHKYNKMILFDAGVGSDIEHFDNHIKKLLVYAGRGDNKNTLKELENLRQCVYMVQNEVSPKMLSFATLVKSIDGNPCDDISEEGLNRIVEMLYDVSVGEVTAHLDGVKKKIDRELRMYFPSLFDDAKQKEYYDELNRRTQNVLQQIITGENRSEEIKESTDNLITFYAPQVFNGRHSVEFSHDRKFEDMCLLLSEKLNVKPKEMTVLEYYNAFEYVKEQARHQKTRNKRV